MKRRVSLLSYSIPNTEPYWSLNILTSGAGILLKRLFNSGTQRFVNMSLGTIVGSDLSSGPESFLCEVITNSDPVKLAVLVGCKWYQTTILLTSDPGI